MKHRESTLTIERAKWVEIKCQSRFAGLKNKEINCKENWEE